MSITQLLVKNFYLGTAEDTTVTISTPSTDTTIVLKGATSVEVPVHAWYGNDAIHQFIQEEVSDFGEPINGEVYVDIEVLDNLLSKCIQISEDPDLAEELLPRDRDWLPPEDGMYGPSYMEDIRLTKDMLIKEKESNSFLKYDYYYSISY